MMLTKRRNSLALRLVAAVFALVFAATAAVAAERYETRQDHHPDGIGKFYLGREISQVMGHQGAEWLERPERDAEEHTTKLVDMLNLRQGDVVADIGAGTGYFARRLAEKVGPKGKIMAVDIQPEMLVEMTNRLNQAGITNVFPVLGTLKDPNLKPGTLDMALLVDVYHELEFPYEVTDAICRALKPGGRLVLVEYRAEDPAVPIKELHKMSEAQVKKEMAVHPLEWIVTHKELPRQHVIEFEKVGATKRKAPVPAK